MRVVDDMNVVSCVFKFLDKLGLEVRGLGTGLLKLDDKRLAAGDHEYAVGPGPVPQPIELTDLDVVATGERHARVFYIFLEHVGAP